MEERKKWSGTPSCPEGWKWERKKPGIMVQTWSKNYYPVLEVYSSIEKCILAGDHDQAFYWSVEYAVMGKAFLASLWSMLFQLGASSISSSATMVYLYNQYKAACSFDEAGAATEDPKVPLVDPKDNEQIDQNALIIALESVAYLCSSPKSRLVDSVVRTFFLTYPSSCPRRPYEPHRDLVHLRLPSNHGISQSGADEGEEEEVDAVDQMAVTLRKRAHPQTFIWCSSYVDEYDESQEESYTLYQLEDQCPPYLAPWCNALFHVLQQLHDGAASVDQGRPSVDQGRPSVHQGRPSVDLRATLERAAFYYAGLIYQCTEPCYQLANRKTDSINLLWDILGKFETDEATNGIVRAIRLVSVEMNRKTVDSRKERLYFVHALVTVVRFFSSSRAAVKSSPLGPTSLPPKIDLDKILRMGLQEVSERVLDFTTKEGKARKHTVADHVSLCLELAGPSSDTFYHDFTVSFERARVEEGIKDRKKTIQVHTPFFRFITDTSKKKKDDETDDAVSRKSKEASDYDLSHFYSLTAAPVGSLPWRGQFIPYEFNLKDGALTSGPHPFQATFKNVRPIESKHVTGLFVGQYVIDASTVVHHRSLLVDHHGSSLIDQRSLLVDVFFIPCKDARQSFYQCLLDELKPIFGVPQLGTHCLFVDETIERANRNLAWSVENCVYKRGRGCHVVMFPVTALGYANCEAVPQTFAEFDTAADLTALGEDIDGRKKKASFFMSDLMPVRNQVTNILLFYMCLGYNGGNLSLMALKKGSVGQQDQRLPEDEADSLVVPFAELAGFTNCTFPTALKKLKPRVIRTLLVNDNSHFMLRFFDLIQFLDYDSIEIVLRRFGAPFVEWSNCIRSNLRDIRCGWLLWTQHSEARELAKREKNRAKQFAWGEKQRAKKTLLGASSSEEGGEKKRARPTTTTTDDAVDEDVVELAKKVTIRRKKKRVSFVDQGQPSVD